MQVSMVMFQCAKDSDASDSMQQQVATAKKKSQNWFKDKFQVLAWERNKERWCPLDNYISALQ